MTKVIDMGSGPDPERWIPGTIKYDWNYGDKDVAVHNLREGIPQPDESVSIIIARASLRYMWNDVEELRFQLEEVFRVLKPGGMFIVTDYSEVFNMHTGEYDVHSFEYVQDLLEESMKSGIEDDQYYLELEGAFKGVPEGHEYVWILNKAPMFVR